jgi:signal transduction histidine kinase
MFGAMNVLRSQLGLLTERLYAEQPEQLHRAWRAVDRILDLELAIMLHTYREDLLAQQSRSERLATFGQLVSSIGHELRNPLGVIESSLYLLKSRAGSDEKLLKHIARIGEQVTISNNIISGLLELIRERPLCRQPVALAELVDSVVASLSVPQAVTMQTTGLATLPTLEGDPTQLRQVLHNLLDNALHAVGSAGTVTVAGQEQGSQIELAVSDSGAGVEPAIRPRLFEPLISAKPDGVGLGLALVKRFVERHGGSIRYAPVAEQPGARFVILLPLGERR